MKKLMIYLLLPAYAVTFTSCMASKTDSKRVAMKENKSKLPKEMCKDAKFAVCAAEGGMLEVKLAELAQSNASSPSVKQFANTMITDHGKSNQELKGLALEKKISLPANLSDKSQKTYEWYTKKKGEDFDKAYMKCMVKDHKKDVCAFKKEAKKGKDPEIKKWASDKVPVLKGHLEMAKNTCKELKKK
jgi:putative membrane protein